MYIILNNILRLLLIRIRQPVLFLLSTTNLALWNIAVVSTDAENSITACRRRMFLLEPKSEKDHHIIHIYIYSIKFLKKAVKKLFRCDVCVWW